MPSTSSLPPPPSHPPPPHTPPALAGAAADDALAATPTPDKALTLPGVTAEPLTFENAVTIGEGTRVLWTKNAADGSVSGALDAASPGWAAFGFPGPAGGMLGGAVVLVQPDPAARGLATARTATLAGYSPEKFASPSPDLKTTGPLTAGIPATGRIAATFTLASVPAGGKVMVATGPMDRTAGGGGGGRLGVHPAGRAGVADLVF